MTGRLSSEDALNELVSIAKQQLRWQQAATLPTVKEALAGALPTTEMRKVYEECDGRRSFREIADATGVPQATIGRWTQSWREVALLFEADSGRMEHLLSLESVGLPVAVDTEGTSRRTKRS